MARRVGKQGPGEGEWQRFRTEARSYFRKSTTTEMVREEVTVPVQAAPAPTPTAPVQPQAPTPRPTALPTPTAPRLELGYLRKWAKPLAFSVPAVGLALLSGAWDPALDLIFKVAGAIGLVVVCIAVFAATMTVTNWVLSMSRYRSEVSELRQQQVSAQVSAPVPDPVPEPVPTAVPEPVPEPVKTRVVTRMVRKRVPVDVDASVAKAEAAARRGGGPAVTDAFPDMPQSVTRLATGAESEESVGLMLERKLGDDWAVAHNLAVMKGRRVSANIDHLLSGPPGLVMVDTKGWSGELYLSGRTLTCDSSFAGSKKARAKAPSTCLYEAAAVRPKVKLIVLAVTRGTVRGGRINVPRPRSASEEGLPDIPVIAMEASAVPAFLEEMGGSSSHDLGRVVATSPKLAWD